MHPLIPIYSIAFLFVLLGLNMRTGTARAVVWVAGWGSMLIIVFGIIFRDVQEGSDSWRYSQTYTQIREMKFVDLLELYGENSLFFVFNWLLGQISSDAILLTSGVALLCLYLLYNALQKIFGPTYTAITLLFYSAFPFWVLYVASGMKQAIALAFLLQAYVGLFQDQRRAWLCLVLAPLFHNAALLVYPFLLLHLLIWRPAFGYRLAMTFSILILAGSIILSVTSLAETILSPVSNLAIVSDRYDIYFMDANELNYRAGFRLDFTLFSLLPLFVALFLQKKGHGLNVEVSGWWLNLYILLISIYHLFAFAPYADRFAGFGWNLIPFILMLLLKDSKNVIALKYAVLFFIFVNILSLQFYIGDKIGIGM